MPRIRRRNQRQILQGRGLTGLGAGRNAGAEAQATAQLGRAIGQVGQAADTVGKTLGTIEARKAGNSFDKTINSQLQEIRKGNIPEGREAGEYAQEVYDNASREALSSTSNPWARQKINAMIDNASPVFQRNIDLVARENFLREVDNTMADIDSQSSENIMTARPSVRGDMVALEKQKYVDLYEQLKENDPILAEKTLKKGMAQLRESYLNSGAVEEATAGDVLQAVMGKSDNLELNELYGEMSSRERASAISSMNSALNRYDSKLAQSSNRMITEVKALQAQGKNIPPSLTQRLVSTASQIRDPMKREHYFSKARVYANFSKHVVASSEGVDGNPLPPVADAKMDVVQAKLQNFVNSIPEDDIIGRFEATQMAQDFFKTETELRREDSFTASMRSKGMEEKRLAALASNDPAQLAEFRNEVAAFQRSMGMPVAVISKAQAKSIASELLTIDGVIGQAERVNTLQQQYGAHFGSVSNQVSGSLGEGKSLALSSVLGSAHYGPEARVQILQNASSKLVSKDSEFLKVRADLDKKDLRKIDEQMFNKFADYNKAFSGTLGGAEQGKNIRSTAVLQARKLMIENESMGISDAVDKAYRDIIERSFEVVSGGNSTILRPRTTSLGDAKTGSQDVGQFLEAFSSVENIEKLNLAVPTAFANDLKQGKVRLQDVIPSSMSRAAIADFRGTGLGAGGDRVVQAYKKIQEGGEISDEDIKLVWAYNVAANSKVVQSSSGDGYKLMLDYGVGGKLGDVAYADGGSVEFSDDQVVSLGSSLFDIEFASQEVPLSQKVVKAFRESKGKEEFERGGGVRGR